MPYTRLYYHFSWATKERQALIDNSNLGPLLKAIAAKVISLKGICHAVNAVSDHVHLVASIPVSLAVSTFIGQVKGSSSHLMSRLHSSQVAPFEWQKEYSVMTISESQLTKVIEYVKNQQSHNMEMSLIPALEKRPEEKVTLELA